MIPAAAVVRLARPADVPGLCVIATAAYAHYTERIGRPAAPMTADYAAAVGRGQVWAAESGGALAGFAVLIPQPGHLLLDNIAVRPADQGRGIGAQLLTLAKEQARERGLSEIRLYTNEAMTENLVYYLRHGYVETHRAEQDGYRRVFFRYRLPSDDAAEPA